MTELRLFSTGAERRTARGHYMVHVNPEFIRSQKLGKFAVIFHDIEHGGNVLTLRAPCRVLSSPDLKKDEVRADQTVRNAIGVPFYYDPVRTMVRLSPLYIPPRLRTFAWLSRRLRVRQLFLRVAKADPPDMEKELIRIPEDAFGLLGVGVGDRVVMESPVEIGGRWQLVSYSIPAYPLTEEICIRRDALQKCALDARYPDASGLLRVQPDIGSAFLDAWARSRLHVDSVHAVRARRDVWNLFLRELREFGIVFGVSLFGLASVLPKLAAGVIAPLIALLLTVINIRARAGSPGKSTY